MIDIPLPQIIQKISTEKGLSEDEVKAKIKSKLDELSGLISEEGAAHIIANELGVKLAEASGQITVEKVLAGMRNFEIVGKVKQVYELREFQSQNRSGKVGSFLIADQTGVIRIVLWNDQADNLKELKPGDIVKLKGVQARNNNSRIEIHVGDNSSFYKNPQGVTVDVDIDATPQSTTKKIAELTEADQNVTVIATIVQVFDPRFFEPKNAAPSDTPSFNYVMNLYLDDGSDNIRCVLWSEQVEALLGKKKEEILTFRENPAAFEEYKTELLGVIVKVRGRIKKNEAFGRLEFVAYEIKTDVDPSAEMSDEAASENKEETSSEENPSIKEESSAPKEESVVEEKPAVKEESSPVQTSTEEKKPPEEDELFTLDDIEDLESLDE